MKFGASLAHENHSAEHPLAAEFLHAETTSFRIAPVARRAARLFVGHDLELQSPSLGLAKPREVAPLYCKMIAEETQGAAPASFDSALVLAPPAMISVILTTVKSCRWPRLRREFFRRRFLKA